MVTTKPTKAGEVRESTDDIEKVTRDTLSLIETFNFWLIDVQKLACDY